MSVFSLNLDQVKYEIRLETRRKGLMMMVRSTSVTASGCNLSRSVEACKSIPFVHNKRISTRIAIVQYLHRTLHVFSLLISRPSLLYFTFANACSDSNLRRKTLSLLRSLRTARLNVQRLPITVAVLIPSISCHLESRPQGR